MLYPSRTTSKSIIAHVLRILQYAGLLHLGLQDQAVHEDLFLTCLTPQMERLRAPKRR